MPIYEYQCRECGTRFEKIVYGTSDPACPSCESTELERLLSTFAVGASGSTTRGAAERGACGTCGDPRGPGSCSLN